MRLDPNELGLFAECQRLSALRADVVSGALPKVVLLRERRMRTWLVAPLLLEGGRSLLLHRDALDRDIGTLLADVKVITMADTGAKRPAVRSVCTCGQKAQTHRQEAGPRCVPQW